VKTISLKKVSAVAVASLGFGLLSVVPAQAATTAATTITASSATLGGSGTAATATGLVGTAVTFTATSTVSATPDAGDTVILTPVLTGTAVVNAASAVTVASTKTSVTPTTATSVMTFGTPNTSTGAVTGTIAAAGAATVVYGFTPDVPGTYIYTINTTGTADTHTNASVTFTYTATMTGAMFLTTGNTPAPVASSVISGSSLSAVVGGFAKFTLAQGGTSDLYNITASGMTISGVSTQLNRTVDTTQLYRTLNGTSVGGGVEWAPASIAGYITVTVSSAVAGTGTLTVQPISSTGVPGTPITGTVLWGAGAAPSAQYSLLTLNKTTGTTATGAADDTLETVASSSNTGGAVERFRIQVVVRDQYNLAYNGSVLSAKIDGTAGSLGINGTANSGGAIAGSSLSAVMTSTNVGSISVFSNGVSGKAVITISSTTPAGVTTVLGTKTVTFAGSAAKVSVTQNLFVAKAGTRLGVVPNATKVTEAGVSTTPAFVAEVMDANGVDVVAGSTVKMTSSDEAVITVGTCAELTTDSDPSTAGAQLAPGIFECSVSGATGAASGKSATVTFSVLNAATGLYSIVATPITFTIGGAISKSVIAVNKTSYTAGEAVELTATSTDASGNKAYDGQTPFASISANKGFGGTNGSLGLTSKEIVNGKYSTTSSKGVASLFAPSTPGSFTISGLATDLATGTAYSVTSSVADSTSAITTQIDALNAKIVALNALIAKIMKKLGVK